MPDGQAPIVTRALRVDPGSKRSWRLAVTGTPRNS